MDSKRFDGFAKEFSRIRSRRAVVQTLVGVAAGGPLAFLGGRRAGAAGEKVSICHRTSSDTNSMVVIEVGVNAVPDHEAHGDFRYTDCCLDGDCRGSQTCINGACQDTCRALGATCNTSNECCQKEETEIRCDVAGCGGTQCCHPGAGSCSNDCDCCGTHCCDIAVPGEKGICDNDCGFD